MVTLRVSDDGAVSINLPGRRSALWSLSMKERAAVVGGRLTVAAAAARTSVTYHHSAADLK